MIGTEATLQSFCSDEEKNKPKKTNKKSRLPGSESSHSRGGVCVSRHFLFDKIIKELSSTLFVQCRLVRKGTIEIVMRRFAELIRLPTIEIASLLVSAETRES